MVYDDVDDNVGDDPNKTADPEKPAEEGFVKQNRIVL